MPQGLMVKVRNGTGLNALFHPTLPFSYIVGSVALQGNFGANVHTVSTTFEAPFPLYKPYFTLGGQEFRVGSYYVEKVAGTEKTYKITIDRYIRLIDARNGYVYYYEPDQPLLVNPRVTIGDIRG